MARRRKGTETEIRMTETGKVLGFLKWQVVGCAWMGIRRRTVCQVSPWTLRVWDRMYHSESNPSVMETFLMTKNMDFKLCHIDVGV